MIDDKYKKSQDDNIKQEAKKIESKTVQDLQKKLDLQ
jgi:hypothetical protein